MTLRSLCFALLFAPTASAAADASLDSRLRSGDGWISYDVAMISDAGSPCCFDDAWKKATMCNLDGRSWSYGTRDGEPPRLGPAVLSVYVHLQSGKADRVRALASTCSARANTPIARLGEIDAGESARWMQQWIAAPPKGADVEPALGALAYTEGAAATAALEALSNPPAERERRKNALFWLGQTRGREGAAVVERVARHDTDPAVREHAVFALSESKAVDGYAIIKDIARQDSSDNVRSQALFWMAQTGDARAASDIRAVLRDESDSDVREQAVFALSQLHGGGDEALIEILRSDAPREVKERAMFWLGQSGSEQALKFLDQVLTASAKR